MFLPWIVSALETTPAMLTCSTSYGERGLFVIEATLLRMFPPASTSQTTFSPMDLGSFTRFFLVPVVASNLISQDLNIPPQQAYATMIESGRAGFSVYAHEDVETDFDQLIYQAFKKADAARLSLETHCPSSSPMSPVPSSPGWLPVRLSHRLPIMAHHQRRNQRLHSTFRTTHRAAQPALALVPSQLPLDPLSSGFRLFSLHTDLLET